MCASVVYIASKPVPTDLIGSVRETERERGVKVRPRGCTLRDRRARGKGPIVKGGRGHYWERERETEREK